MCSARLGHSSALAARKFNLKNARCQTLDAHSASDIAVFLFERWWPFAILVFKIEIFSCLALQTHILNQLAKCHGDLL